MLKRGSVMRVVRNHQKQQQQQDQRRNSGQAGDQPGNGQIDNVIREQQSQSRASRQPTYNTSHQPPREQTAIGEEDVSDSNGI